MKNDAAPFAWIVIAAGLAATPAAAGGLDCGKPPEPNQKADTVLSKAITSSRPDKNGHVALVTAIQTLRGEGVSRALIVDHAVAAYCPQVARDDSLSLDQKREAVRRFASTLTSIVYDPLDSTEQADTAIILNVPVKPLLSEQIDVAAAKAGQTRDAWILQAVQAKLAGQ